eukprot:1160186-Pelagomonas_calceolata.AAC.7
MRSPSTHNPSTHPRSVHMTNQIITCTAHSQQWPASTPMHSGKGSREQKGGQHTQAASRMCSAGCAICPLGAVAT